MDDLEATNGEETSPEQKAQALAIETLRLARVLEEERIALAVEVAKQLRKDLWHLKLLIITSITIAVVALVA